MDNSLRRIARIRPPQKVQEVESHYLGLFDGIPVGLYRSTPAGRFLDVNLTLVRMLGYPDRETLLAVDVVDLYESLETRARWQELMDREGDVRDFEIRLRRYDDTVIWLRESSQTVRDRGDQVLHYEGSLEDITEHKQAEESLRQTERLNQAVIEHSPVGISVRNRTGELLLSNAAWKRIRALSEQEIQEEEQKSAGMPFAERYSYLGSTSRDVARIFEFGGNLFIPEIEYESPKFHAARWVSQYLYALCDERGQVELVVTLTQDITERKQAETALQKSEEKYRTILESIQDGYFEVDLAGNFTFFNDAMCRIVGYTHSEMMGMNNRQYMDKENAKKVFEVFNRVYTTGKPAQGFDWMLTDKDGARKFVEVSVSLIRDSHGEPIGFQGVARDITERKQAEEALRRYAERLRFQHETDRAILAAQSPEEIVLAALERIRQLVPCQRASVTAFDLAAKEITVLAAIADGDTRVGMGTRRPLEGFLPEELWRGENWILEDIHGTSQTSSIARALQQEGIRAFLRVPLRVQDELIGTLNLGSAQPGAFAAEHADIAGEIADSLAVAIQNARLHEAAQARSRYLETLQQINATLRSTLPLDEVLETIARGTGQVLGYAGTIIVVPDAERERLHLGAAWGKRFLDAALRFTGLKLSSLSLPLTADENPMAQAYRTGELQAWSRAPERIVQGVEPAVGTRLAPLFEGAMGAHLAVCVPLPAGQTIVGVLAAFSPREQLPDEEQAMLLGLAAQAGMAIENARLYENLQNQMEELKQAQAQLVQSAKMAAIGQLAAGVAHELNNPLTSVLGFAELMLRGVTPDDPNQKRLTIIASEARRARDIVRGLLDFARQTEFRQQPADVNRIVQETLALIRQRLEKGGVALEEHYAPDLLPLLLDTSRIKQVVLNLATNALHAMPRGGTLTVTSEQVRDGVAVRFADTGMGIAEKHLPRIFEPFFTTKAVGEGVGLGLSISLGIVQDHGGNLEVESQEGKGSTFTVWLPASCQEDQNP